MDKVQCLIAGGGPAGVMLGLLLARAGVRVTVMEKHKDFLRDFRGDTVHPSTIRLLDEMGLGEGFRALPQSKVDSFVLPDGDGGEVTLASFERLKPPYDYVAMVPQWDLLDFLTDQAKQEETFDIRMLCEVTGLLREDGKVTGVTWRAYKGDETGEIHADLVVGCDGRQSTLREAAGVTPRDYPVPFDLWWFRLPRKKADDQMPAILPVFKGEDILLTIPRDDFYQLAYFIRKGDDPRRRAEGLEAFRQRIASIRPDFADRVDAITSLDEVKMLDVRLDRLGKWFEDGLLLIGDAAHAMSPAGGVGINLAIQDAVATARILADPLKNGTLTRQDLLEVQDRRLLPARIIQFAQRVLHRVMFEPAFEGQRRGAPKALVFLARHVPAFRAIPAWLVGFGPRPEHAPDFARPRKNT